MLNKWKINVCVSLKAEGKKTYSVEFRGIRERQEVIGYLRNDEQVAMRDGAGS